MTDKPLNQHRDAESILLVDDDPTLTQVMQRAFVRRGFNVCTANNIAEALSCAEDQPFDKAVVDLKLAQESGLSLIPQLKALQPQLEIIMLTGYSSIHTAVEAIKLGASNYLCKPADADDLLQAFGHTRGNTEADIQSNPLSVNRLEWEHIQKVLAENDGNVSATARALGMHRRTLQRKLQKKPVKQ